VPGYRLRLGPFFDDNKVTIMIEVEGAGDFLPKYARDLDREISAAVAIGELIAEKLVEERVKVIAQYQGLSPPPQPSPFKLALGHT